MPSDLQDQRFGVCIRSLIKSPARSLARSVHRMSYVVTSNGFCLFVSLLHSVISIADKLTTTRNQKLADTIGRRFSQTIAQWVGCLRGRRRRHRRRHRRRRRQTHETSARNYPCTASSGLHGTITRTLATVYCGDC